jgi:hypothetical protein
MVDSELVAVGGEVAAWVTDLLVVDEASSEGEHSQCDADADSEDGAATVSFERELPFAGPEGNRESRQDDAGSEQQARLHVFTADNSHSPLHVNDTITTSIQRCDCAASSTSP